MALLNLPSVSAPSVQPARFSGPTSNGGSASQSQSVSESKPVLIRPDADRVQQGFNTLQGGIQLSRPQQQAVNVQQSVGQTLQSLLANAGQQGSRRIQEGFQGATDRASEDLIRRGIDPALVQQTGAAGQSRETGFLEGDFKDQLLDRNVDSRNQVSSEISNLLFGSSDQATDLINALLGSGSIGNFRRSGSQSVSTSKSGL